MADGPQWAPSPEADRRLTARLTDLTSRLDLTAPLVSLCQSLYATCMCAAPHTGVRVSCLHVPRHAHAHAHVHVVHVYMCMCMCVVLSCCLVLLCMYEQGGGRLLAAGPTVRVNIPEAWVRGDCSPAAGGYSAVWRVVWDR